MVQNHVVTVMLLTLVSVVYFALAILTALGQRRRTASARDTAAAAIAWPITWVVWYVRDTR